MSQKTEYNSKPKSLLDIAISKIVKNNDIYDNNIIDELPNTIKDKINDLKKHKNNIFIDKAFTDLVNTDLVKTKGRGLRFYYKSLKDSDIIYLMYKLRDDPDLIVKSGYTKYSFNLNINNDTGNDDSIYTLTITETETGATGVYETTVGRFD